MVLNIDPDISTREYVGNSYVDGDDPLIGMQWLEDNNDVQQRVCCTSKEATDWLVLHTNVPREMITERLSTSFQAWPRYRTWHSAKE
jgi:hypothetical protein